MSVVARTRPRLNSVSVPAPRIAKLLTMTIGVMITAWTIDTTTVNKTPMPKVRQKNPRVSCHERRIAAKGPITSTIMAVTARLQRVLKYNTGVIGVASSARIMERKTNTATTMDGLWSWTENMTKEHQ